MPSAIVIHPELRNTPSSRPPDMMLEEVCLLAQAIDLKIAHAECVALSQIRAGSFFGKGINERLANLAHDFNQGGDGPIIIINSCLTPVQQRNLETVIKFKVIDRTQLIIEIFGARAQTHAGRLQVELAALTFQRSRLVRSWTHLERQRGGSGFLGGPGERQIELDRRMLLARMVKIKSELKEVSRTRKLQRSNRLRGETQTVALIGYTNSGKSTLFNRLTGADVLSKDMLFATLDPTIRELHFCSGRKAVLADTVGFVSQLPTDLVEAFKSTLEEVLYADVLLHVHDASSPMIFEEAIDVAKVLTDLGMSEEDQTTRIVHVLNKADLINADDSYLETIQRKFLGVFVSALTGDGADDLMAHLDQRLSRSSILVNMDLSPADGDARAWLHQNAMVKSSRFNDEGHEKLLISIDPSDYKRFTARWPNKLMMKDDV